MFRLRNERAYPEPLAGTMGRSRVLQSGHKHPVEQHADRD